MKLGTKDIRELPVGSLIPGTDLTKMSDVFMKEVGTKGKRQPYVPVTCSCGTERDVYVGHICKGRTSRCHSCGHKGECNSNYRDGSTSHPIYNTWINMKRRCTNPKTHNYKNYGGRGISVHESFLDFVVFREYMESLPNYDRRVEDNLSIDRIDNDGNYEPGNLRWATNSEQQYNKRKRK